MGPIYTCAVVSLILIVLWPVLWWPSIFQIILLVWWIRGPDKRQKQTSPDPFALTKSLLRSFSAPDRDMYYVSTASPGADIFGFLKKWLCDGLHLTMLTHLLSGMHTSEGHQRHIEDICIWLLNYAAWKYEVEKLSDESKTLERLVIDKSNFNTLRLIDVRKKASKTQDDIKTFREQTPTFALAWVQALDSWMIDQRQTTEATQDPGLEEQRDGPRGVAEGEQQHNEIRIRADNSQQGDASQPSLQTVSRSDQ